MRSAREVSDSRCGLGVTFTAFSLLTGFLRPDYGHIVFDGTPLTGLAAHRTCLRGMVRTFQNPETGFRT